MEILIIHGSYENMASTVYDHISAFKKYSEHNISLYEIQPHNMISLDLNRFATIVIHYSASLFNENYFGYSLVAQLKKFTGRKALFIQDEYRFVDKIIEMMNYMNITILFTCIPETEIEKVYPKEHLPKVTKIQTMTGYVPEYLLNAQLPTYEARAMDVVYRARKLSASYGRLAQEKWQIVDKFSTATHDMSLKTDIAYREEDRIYGNDWVNFLSNSKAMLGVESGASVFDFSGTIVAKVQAYELMHPEASFEKIEALYFPKIDGKIYVNQISPRCFEAAALRTLMVLYEGYYSGILEPWRHYVPLKKDCSNIDEVIAAIKNKEKWHEITDNAYREIALNPEYSFRRFVRKCDHTLALLVASECASVKPFYQIKIGWRIEHLKRKFLGKIGSGMMIVYVSILRKLSEKNREHLRKICREMFYFITSKTAKFQFLQNIYMSKLSQMQDHVFVKDKKHVTKE